MGLMPSFSKSLCFYAVSFYMSTFLLTLLSFSNLNSGYSSAQGDFTVTATCADPTSSPTKNPTTASPITSSPITGSPITGSPVTPVPTVRRICVYDVSLINQSHNLLILYVFLKIIYDSLNLPMRLSHLILRRPAQLPALLSLALL